MDESKRSFLKHSVGLLGAAGLVASGAKKAGAVELWQLWQRLPGPAGVRAWEVYVTGTGATRGVPAAGGR